jgi:adenosine deaminase
LVEYLRGFDITLRVLQKPYAITRAMFEVCEDAYNDGIRYIEVRFSPILHLNQGLSQGAVMEAVCEGREMAMNRYPINVGVIVCAMRQMDSEVTASIAEVAWRYRTRGVVGFDLAGPEFGFSSKLHKKAFDIVRKRCVNCTLHSGEAAGWESVNDSIQYCGATRIGHGVALKENPELVEFVADKGISIECCPTSNLHTKAIQKITDHPIRDYFQKGIICVPCTDNVTVSNVRLSEEYLLLHEKYHFSVPEIVKLLDYGFCSGFMPPISKRRIRADALFTSLKILSENHFDLSAVVNDRYFADIGVDYASLGLAACPEVIVPGILKGGEPEITDKVIKALPKADLHCRLDGSLPLTYVWEQLQAQKVDISNFGGKGITTLEAFGSFMSKLEGSASSEDVSLAKGITQLVLQTKNDLENACELLITRAVADNVKYIEIVVRPFTHLKKEFQNPNEVISVINQKCLELVKSLEGKIAVGIIINISTLLDDPLAFNKLALATIEAKANKDSLVCGFGVYGPKPISYNSLHYFQATFDLLKEHKINVAISSGYENGEDIIGAIHQGGAARISGAFALHSRPSVMQYLAQNHIPIEIGWTPRMKYHTTNVYSGNLIRTLIENSIPVAFCTFRANGDLTSSRTESLLAIAKECKMNFADLVNFLSQGFRHNFQHYQPRTEGESSFWKEVAQVAKTYNFNTVIPAMHFPKQ